MNSLVQLTIDAHGDFGSWRQFELVSVHLRNEGILWGIPRWKEAADDKN
jgi:hypothetical protein